MPARTPATRVALAVLVICTGFNLFARGISETFAVFLIPLELEFGWPRATLTGIYSLFMLTNGLASPLAGLLFDRLGPRWSYGLGLSVFGLGYLLAGRAQELWHFYLGIGLMGGLGVALISMVPASALISRWFRDRLTTAMGIAYGGLGCGVLLLVPLTQVLIEQFGWRVSYTMLGIVLLGLLSLLALPWNQFSAGHPIYARDSALRTQREGHWNLPRALRDRAFWALTSVFFFTAVAVYAVAPQVVVYLVEVGFDPLQAASAYGLTGMLSVGGMVGMAWLADRFGRRKVVTLSYCSTIIGILVLLLMQNAPHYPLLVLFVLLFGSVQGSRGPVVFALAARLFAGGGLGSIYGAITLGMGVGAALASWLSGWLHDITGAYHASFSLAIAAAGTGILLFWLIPELAD